MKDRNILNVFSQQEKYHKELADHHLKRARFYLFCIIGITIGFMIFCISDSSFCGKSNIKNNKIEVLK